MSPTGRLHAVTWTVWMVAAAVSVQATTNPLYSAAILLVAVLVVETHGRQSPLARAFPIMVALATVFGLVRIALTSLTTHATGSPVLFTWPLSFKLPNVFGGFVVFGTLEQEPLLRSTFEAFAVVAFISVFAAWNAVVSHHEVMRGVPRAFHETALIVTIAISVVPSTIATLQAVHLADRARCGGQPVRRGRIRRLVIPVVEGGLEQAIALAESMESRGLGFSRPNREERVSGWCTLGALAAMGGAVVALVSRNRTMAAVLAVVSACAFAVGVVVASRAQQRSRYRRRPLTRADAALITASLISLAIMVLLVNRDAPSMQWSPYPLHWPTVNAFAVAAIIGLALPALSVPTASVRNSEPAWAQ